MKVFTSKYISIGLTRYQTIAYVLMFKHSFCQQYNDASVFHSLMSAPANEDFERCNELRQWLMDHSGERPFTKRKILNNKAENSLALWLDRALVRRTRVLNNRPRCRQLTASETAHLNSILAQVEQVASVFHSLMTGPAKEDFERCNELRQWCISHSGERPHRRYCPDDTSETSLAMWLDRAMSRRARAHNNRPSGRQLTATETAHLHSILARPQVVQVAVTASVTSSGVTATELITAPEGAEPPELSPSKRVRQKSSASNRFITAVQRMKTMQRVKQRLKRTNHAQFCF